MEVYLDLPVPPLLEGHLDLLRPNYHLDQEPKPMAPLLRWAAPWQRLSPPSEGIPSRMSGHCLRHRELLQQESSRWVYYLAVLLLDSQDLGYMGEHRYRQSPR